MGLVLILEWAHQQNRISETNYPTHVRHTAVEHSLGLIIKLYVHTAGAAQSALTKWPTLQIKTENKKSTSDQTQINNDPSLKNKGIHKTQLIGTIK